MKRSRFHPDHLRFPMPPARIDRTLAVAPLLPAVAATYLSEIRRWRDTVVTAIAEKDPALAGMEDFTPRARRRLAHLLETTWDAKTGHWAAVSDYDLTPFPAIRPVAQAARPMEAVLEVLRWRAAVVSYLTDVWDGLSKPELEMRECAAIGAFMRPVRMEGTCVYCLTEFPPDRLDPEDHGCVIMTHALAR